MTTIGNLMSEIERCLHEGGDWCDIEKAQTLAALVVGLRPRVVCEIGVWMGGSLIPMALALRSVRGLRATTGGAGGSGSDADLPDARDPRDPDGPVEAYDPIVIGIDPWAASDSCVGQDGANAKWWSSVNHEDAMRVFLTRVDRHQLRNLVRVQRSTSDDAAVPPSIDLLHVDGNHADQARRDVTRFAPSIVHGGILVLDDLTWAGGHVRRAHDLAVDLGFRDLYPLGTGVVMRREEAARWEIR